MHGREWVRKRSILLAFCCVLSVQIILGGFGAGSIFDDDWTPPAAVTAKKPKPEAAPQDPTASVPAIPVPTVVQLKPIPTEAEQLKVRKLFRDVFSAELKDGSSVGRRKLALRLMDEVARNADAPVDQFVLLIGAVDAARQGSDLRLCVKAADNLAATFGVDAFRLKTEAALNMTFHGEKPAISAENCRAGLELADAAEASGDRESSLKLLTAMRPTAAVDPMLRDDVTKRIRSAEAARESDERLARDTAKLKSTPDDPAANLAVGQELCFNRDKWAAGLPHLTKGSDAVLQGLATRDLAAPTAIDELIALGTGWWDGGAKRDPATRDAMRARGYKYLMAALPRIKGLQRTAVEKRLAESPYIGATPGEVVMKFVGHSATVTELAFTPDGRSAVSVSLDSTVRLWDLLNGKEIRRFEGHGSRVFRLGMPDVGRAFVTGGADGTVRLWDLDSTKPTRQFNVGSDCWSACFSPDAKFVLFAGNLVSPSIVPTSTFKADPALHAEGGYSSAWSADSKLFATGGWNGIAHVFDVKTKKEVASLNQQDQVYGLGFSPDNRRLLSIGATNGVHVWDLQNSRELRVINPGHESRSVAFTPDSRLALIGSGKPSLIFWNLATGQPAFQFEGQESGTRGVAISKSGRLALTGGEDGVIRLWRLPDLK